jgi:RNA dependent RNA polymerase
MNDRPMQGKNIFDVVNFLLRSGRQDSQHLCRKGLESMLDRHGRTAFPCRLFVTVLRALDLSEAQEPLPRYCTLVPRMSLTPCKEALEGLHIEMSNRVIRKFVDELGFSGVSFLRVHVTDEDGQKLRYTELESEEIEARVRTALVNGILVNGTRYHFLAYSSSQLKEFSVWMVSEEQGFTVDAIRNNLGAFADWKGTVPKLAARMGQCFSTTMALPKTTDDESQIRRSVVPDIETMYLGRKMCHTDGVGLIRREVLTDQLRNLDITSNPDDISIIQIRHGGAKGTLVAWAFDNLPQSESLPGISGYDVLLRNSMIKFEAEFGALEVCRLGKKVPYYLNRQVILILVKCGVSPQIFIDKARDMIQMLDRMLTDAKCAFEMVSKLSGPDQETREALIDMLHIGLVPTLEPFLFSCCHAIRSHHLYGLRKKTRIFVEKGAVLMGGIDETGLLPEGCIHISVNQSLESAFETIVGPVLVTKHPVTYIGDVRMLLAVDIPSLRQHRNVVLFSQHGLRPEPNKMSGSDLDGDEYAVTWDDRLFLQRSGTVWQHLDLPISASTSDQAKALARVNHEPMEYFDPPSEQVKPPFDMFDVFAGIDFGSLSGILTRLDENFDPPPAQQPVPIDASDIAASGDFNSLTRPDCGNTNQTTELVQFFIKFAKNDVLGAVATLWLEHAAKSGADCEACKELAKQHSIAVDFAKTGIYARIRPDLWNVTPPHWREKKGSRSFHDEGVIGAIYDIVTSAETAKNITGDQHGKPPAVAGRRTDQYGQLLSLVEGRENWVSRCLPRVFYQRIPEDCGLADNGFKSIPQGQIQEGDLVDFAVNERLRFNGLVVTTMNRLKVRSEGEMFTGCIRKYHRLHKKRQFEFAEEVRRACRTLRSEFRVAFFEHVLQLAMEKILASEVPRAGGLSSLVNWVKEISTAEEWESIACPELGIETTELGSFLRQTAHRLAAAYYVATYSPEVRLIATHPENTDENLALFSFPWTVADVIAAAMRRSRSPS